MFLLFCLFFSDSAFFLAYELLLTLLVSTGIQGFAQIYLSIIELGFASEELILQTHDLLATFSRPLQLILQHLLRLNQNLVLFLHLFQPGLDGFHLTDPILVALEFRLKGVHLVRPLAQNVVFISKLTNCPGFLGQFQILKNKFKKCSTCVINSFLIKLSKKEICIK